MNILILLNYPIRWLIFAEMLLKWSVQVRFSQKIFKSLFSSEFMVIDMYRNVSKCFQTFTAAKKDELRFGAVQC